MGVALTLLVALFPALVAVSTPLVTPLPLNGDFEQGSLNWATEGLAAVQDRKGTVGAAGCTGDEGTAVIGRLTTIAGVPLPHGARITYDYRVETSESDPLAGLRLVAIGPATGARLALDVFNPNTQQGVCGAFEGQRSILLHGLSLDSAYARLEFHVWGDAEGDLFFAEVDNLVIVT